MPAVYPVTPAQYLEPSLPSAGSLLFASGSDRYYVTGAEVGNAEATLDLWILKSSDGGSTWTQIVDYPLTLEDRYFAAAVQAGTKIWILASSGGPATPIRVFSLDTATDILTASGDGPVAVAGGIYRSLAALPDGSVVAIGNKRAAHFNGATWDSAIVIPVSSEAGVVTVVSTAWDANRIVLFGRANVSAVACLFCLTLDTATLTPPADWQRVYTPGAGTSIVEFEYSCCCAGNVAQLLKTTAAGEASLRAICGPSADSGSLVLTDNRIVSESDLPAGSLLVSFPYNFNPWPDASLAAVGSTLYCFYIVSNPQTFAATDRGYLYYQTAATCGAWSAPVLAYTSALSQDLITPYPAAVSASAWSVLFGAIDPILFFGSIQTKYESLSVFLLASTVPLAATWPDVPGSVGVPYSHGVDASGGTPPYSFAVTSGSLPPGLSLDGSTGVVSGVPTSGGTYLFTITVTDSGSQTVSVPASLRITNSFLIQLLGWKLYPVGCPPDDSVREVEECPPVERAV